MGEAVLDFFLHNGNEYNTLEFNAIYGDNPPSIYEVIRIIDGVPLFLEEHYTRLKKSAAILENEINMSFNSIKISIEKMVRINNVSNHNIKIVINNFTKNTNNNYFFFIKSNYPNEDLYSQGIRTLLYNFMRENPNAKIINKSLRKEVDILLTKKNCYEALLVNFLGEVTEGSRSNLFFIKEGKVYTSPPGDVLMGITRQRIVKLCTENNIKVIEAPIYSNSLDSYEAAFISGTSPKVLPIASIDDLQYSTSNETLLKVMEAYNNEIENYLKLHK
ncbi:MAG: aminotransferase class [Clostridiales bacterium]|nr:aminotransferase class [Clostridiales bacterium]